MATRRIDNEAAFRAFREDFSWEDQHDVVLAKLWKANDEIRILRASADIQAHHLADRDKTIANVRSVSAIKDDTIAIQARRSAGKDKDLADLRRQLVDANKENARLRAENDSLR